MANKIILKKTSTASKVPLSTDLEIGEIAVNLADQKLYSKNASGTVILVGSGASGGTGDVVGPSSATDNALARFDGTTGKLIQNGTITQDDTGNLSGILSETYNTVTTPPAIVEGLEAWDSGNGTLEVGLKGGNVSYKYGQQEFVMAYNGSGSAMTKGQVVYIVGAQGNRVDVRLALATSDATSAGTIGFVAEAIANGAEGFVQVSGTIPKLNTSALTAGQTVYLSPTTAGEYTTTKPTAPNHTVVLGWVERVSTTVGSIYIKVDNGYELDELHNVLITSPTSGNTLIYDAVQGVWENANISAGTGISVTNGAGSISIANTGVTSFSAGTTGLTPSTSTTGAISLAGTLAIANGGSGATTASTALSNLGGVPLSGGVSMTGSLYTRGSFGMKSSTIAGNPLLYDVQDQAGNVVIEIGRTDGVSGTSVFDFHSGATAVDYDARMQAIGGNGTVGGGTLNFLSANFRHNSVDVVTVSGTQTLTNKTISGASNTFSNIANASLTNSSITINGTAVSLGSSYSVPNATATVAGLIELGDGTVQTVAANAVTATASRTYALQVNASGQGVVNVPWTDTNSGGTVTSVGGTGSINGLTLTGTVTTTGNLTLGGSITSVATTGNFQMNSLGVGTAGSATAGEIRATNNVTAYYASDRKWKENIKPINGALEKVKAIGGKTFDWTEEYIEARGGVDGYFVRKEDFGVVAQDVQKVFPQAIRTRADGTLAVDYAKLSALALQAIAELSIKVSNLERKLKD